MRSFAQTGSNVSRPPAAKRLNFWAFVEFLALFPVAFLARGRMPLYARP
jgi:hypothetical protein